jgi:triosephosphate isomerase
MWLPLPVLFINFKTHAMATGNAALSLAKKAERVALAEKVSIALVVQATDIRLVSKSVKLPVFAQHIDPIGIGGNTGHILPEAVKQAGATGTILNHAENKRNNNVLLKSISRAKRLGLTTMVCAESVVRAKQIASFPKKPELIAIEPPELIGGRVSVSSAKPRLIRDGVRAIKEIAPKITVITGAGIKNASDVEKAIQLGTKGVFVSSGIVKAQNQEKAIRELVAGLKG